MSRFNLSLRTDFGIRFSADIRHQIVKAGQRFHAMGQWGIISLGLVLCVALPQQSTAAAIGAADDSLTQVQADTLSGLRDGDARLNAIFWRLSSANARYCDPVVHATGIVLHARSAYLGPWRDAAQRFFGFEGEVAVEAIDPDSPASGAGIQADDTLIAIAGHPLGPETGTEAVAAAYTALARAGAGGTVTLTLRRAGQTLDMTVPTVPVCTQRVELNLTAQRNARTDGEIIQINSIYMNQGFSDDMLASVIAHELGHYVLHHPQRLEKAGAYRGLSGLLGGKRALIRLTEDQADRISPWLMVNAGYDPAAAIDFWKTMGDSILNDPSHAQPSQRSAMIAQEIEQIKRSGQPPLKPPYIDGRDKPLR